MIGKKPKRPKGGFKIHEKQVQDLWDWLNYERVLDGPGVQNTANGKKITWRADDFSPMFKPFFNRESKYIIKMGIRTGYVFAPYDDGNSTHLPMLHRFPFEPKIGSNLLSSTPSPKLTLETGSTNYIYLKFTWKYFSSEIGGTSVDGEHAFVVDGHDHGGSGDTDVLHVSIDKLTYYLHEAEFISQTTATPPTETENSTQAVTNMLCGWIKLDANGDLNTATNDGSRWFLQGPIYIDRHPSYVTGESADRFEPVAPVASSGETIPGA